MKYFLISLLLCLPSVAHAKRLVIPPVKYDKAVVVEDPNAKNSYWRLWTRPDGCRVLVVVKRVRKDERVYPVPLHWNPPKQPARPKQPVKPTPKPIVITNPYVE